MKRRTFIAGSTCGILGAINTRAFASNDVQVKNADELILPKTKSAIDRGLRYLARRQITSGGNAGCFGTSGYASGVAVTALAGLAFMCNGSTPISGPYAKNVKLCTKFILANTRDTGYIARINNSGFSNMYGHGYAMLYLSQVCGMSTDSVALEKLRTACKMTCDIQNKDGGWRYQPVKQGADLSITICQIMALRAARDAGIDIPDEVRTKTLGYVKKSQNSDGSFHYTLRGGRVSLALTAAGVVSLYSAGIYEGEMVEKALTWLRKNKPGVASARVVSPMNYYYAHYYGVQAMWHAQLQHPEYWNEWYPLIRDELYGKRSGDGTWPDSRVGPEFATAMSCIIMQIPYNFLPVFAP